MVRISNTKRNKAINWIEGDYIYLRLMSRHPSLFQPSNLDVAFDDFLKVSDQKLLGYNKSRDILTEMMGRPISSLFSEDKSNGIILIITDGEMTLYRTPEKAFLDTCEANTELDITLPKDYDHGKALEIFKNAVVHFKMFWGEFNDTPVTEKPTFQQFDGHYYVAPRPTLINYYGPEYIKLFGGRKKLKAAGFDSVTHFHKGVLVSLESCQTAEQFKARQKEVQENLGQMELFENKGTPHIHEALWNIKVKSICLDEAFSAIDELKASGELVIEEGDQLEIIIEKKQTNKYNKTPKK